MPAAATSSTTDDAENSCTAEGVFEGGGLFTKNIEKVGFSMSPTRLGEAESNPLFFRANSATSNAPSIDMVLDGDPDTRRNVPTAPLLAP